MNTLDQERTRYIDLRRRLLELHPELDDQTLNDTLEGATDFREALAALVRSALEDECLAHALKERLSQMRGRLARLEGRSASKRQVVLENMQATQVHKLSAPDFTASVKICPPAVTIVAEDDLPIDYLQPQPPKPDKRAILEALNKGTPVPGAVLSETKHTLSVRSQ
jgi:hypothetical protein